MESAPTLFQAWSPYDVVLDQNYMFHRELHDRVGRILAGRSADGAYDLLDLGCGRARHLARILQDHPPASYRGFDLSTQALGLARENLAFLGERVRLVNADLTQGPGSGPADVVFSAFAIHHLDHAAKAALFRSIRSGLRPGGIFLLVDVVRDEGEPREAFLERYSQEIRSRWVALAERDVRDILEHIRTCDFPETDRGIRALARDAGLGECRDTERHGCHQLWGFGGW
jgi:SAM-dependent methyltransferase